MKNERHRIYQPHEFAKHAGVTVRTLHYYDRLGLLKPSEHSGAGFRRYSESDLGRLEQIVALKFIGFSLKEIKRLLDRRGLELAGALAAQRMTLEVKRRHLDLAIGKAEKAVNRGSAPDWEVFRNIIEEIQMQTNTEWQKKYYSDEAQKALEQGAANWNPQLQAKAEQDWNAVVKDVQAALQSGEDPGGKQAQEIAGRWLGLMSAFTQGNPAVAQGLNKVYEDRAEFPNEFGRQFNPQVSQFIGQALEILQAGKRRSK